METLEDMPSEDLDQIIERSIGKFGKYQFTLCAVSFLIKLPMAFHISATIYIAPDITFYCIDDGKNITNKCPCKNFQYDRREFHSTISMQWNLICEKAPQAELTQVILMVGILFGSILFGALSDKYGRKPQLMITVVLQLVCGFLTAVVPYFWLFVFLRLAIGFTIGGMMVVGYVLMMEFIGKDYRAIVSALYQLPFILGILMTPLFANILRDWRILYTVFSLFNILLLTSFWLIPESARWLLAVGQEEQAIQIFESAAKKNNLPTENIRRDLMNYQRFRTLLQMKKGTVMDLFRTPNIRRNTIAMSTAWTACGFGYYGLLQFIGRIEGDIYLNVVIAGLFNIPSILISIPAMKYVRRKIVFRITFLTSAVCLFIFATLPENLVWFKVILIAIGISAIFTTFIIAYLYTSELYPTVIRNVGMDVCSTLSRIGSIAAPTVASMSTKQSWLPPLIFGIVPIIGVIATLFLPETKGISFPTTIEDGEKLKHKSIMQINGSAEGTDSSITN